MGIDILSAASWRRRRRQRQTPTPLAVAALALLPLFATGVSSSVKATEGPVPSSPSSSPCWFSMLCFSSDVGKKKKNSGQHRQRQAATPFRDRQLETNLETNSTLFERKEETSTKNPRRRRPRLDFSSSLRGGKRLSVFSPFSLSSSSRGCFAGRGSVGASNGGPELLPTENSGCIFFCSRRLLALLILSCSLLDNNVGGDGTDDCTCSSYKSYLPTGRFPTFNVRRC